MPPELWCRGHNKSGLRFAVTSTSNRLSDHCQITAGDWNSGTFRRDWHSEASIGSCSVEHNRSRNELSVNHVGQLTCYWRGLAWLTLRRRCSRRQTLTCFSPAFLHAKISGWARAAIESKLTHTMTTFPTLSETVCKQVETIKR